MRAKPGDVVAWLPHGPSGAQAGPGCVMTQFNPPVVIVGVLENERTLNDHRGHKWDPTVAPTWLFVADEQLRKAFFKRYEIEDPRDFDKSG